MQCPKCSYICSLNETVPEWQCPSCGIAYEKYRMVQEKAQAAVSPSLEFTNEYRKRKALLYSIYGFICFLITVAFGFLPLQGPGLLIPSIGSYIFFTNATLLLTTGTEFSEINRGENIPFWKKVVAFAVGTAMFFLFAVAFFFFVGGRGMRS